MGGAFVKKDSEEMASNALVSDYYFANFSLPLAFLSFQGPVVQMPITANAGIKAYRGFLNFSCIKVF